MARATPAHPGKMLYFFHIVKEQPISPGQKPEANRAPRAPLASGLSAYRTRSSGGAGRDRTDDPLLAKQVLSQLSYSPLGARPLTVARKHWWVWMDSNHRPPPYQDGALTN